MRESVRKNHYQKTHTLSQGTQTNAEERENKYA